MTQHQIKSFVAIRNYSEINHFGDESDEQIVGAYYFTEQLRSLGSRLLRSVASGSGATAIMGGRGTGKSHLLALIRSLANRPDLLNLIVDLESRKSLQLSLGDGTG